MVSGGEAMGKSDQNGVSRDPEVEPRPTRRRIGDPEKKRILAEVDQARGTGKINEMLRREGISSSQLTEWRKKFGNGAKGRSRNSKRPGGAKEIRRLEGENARLKEQLRVAELVIGIQKKVSALMGRPLGEDGKPLTP
jgi:transposase-like protein